MKNGMRPHRDEPDLLGEILKNVSRSFYLTLRVLPSGLREPIGLAYLLARAADTIADTEIIAPELRLELLLAFRSQLHVESGKRKAEAEDQELHRIENAVLAHQCNLHEQKLLQSLRPAFEVYDALASADRHQVQHVVTILTTGMEFDLRTFPSEKSGELRALNSLLALEHYTYMVAGCVGDFWTRITAAHTPALKVWELEQMSAVGIRFGKALQYTNVLRDIPRDLRIGRCYFPVERLAAHGLTPPDLLKPENSARALPVLVELLGIALDHYEEARNYLLAIPERCGRLRLACLWPVLIGLATLEKLANNKEWLDPSKPSKVSRSYVKRTLFLSLPAAGSNTLLNKWINCKIADVRASIGA